MMFGLSRFFNRQKSTSPESLDVRRPLTFAQIKLGTAKGDGRYAPKQLLAASKDPIAVRCIKLISNSTLSGGWRVQAKYGTQQRQIEELLKRLDIDNKNQFILNSILGPGGDCLAFFINQNGQYQINLESFYWNGTQRIWADINEKTKEFQNSFTVKDSSLRLVYNLSLSECYQISSQNVENDVLGTTPLFSVSQRVLEKQALVAMNQYRALRKGKTEGIFTPDAEYFKSLSPADRAEYMRELNDTISILTETDNNVYQDYVIAPLALNFTPLSTTNRESQYMETIRQINYEICASFGVPSSLVNFDESTDPNLSNASQYRDNFAELNTNDYKLKLERFWTWVIESVFPNYDFQFILSREQTDETIELRDQLMRSVELCQTLQNLGINARPKLEVLEKLGIEITNPAPDVSDAEEEQEFESLDLLEELEASNKASKPAYKNMDPPNIEDFLQSKPFKSFRNEIKALLELQIDQMFSKLVKEKSIRQDNAFYQKIITAIPTLEELGFGVQDLYDLIKEKLLPEIIKEVNAFYNTSYTINNLPEQLQNDLMNVANLTIRGNPSQNYFGVDSTTAIRTTESLGKILQKQNFNLDDYNKLTDHQKAKAWKDLRAHGQDLLIESRTDLIAEMMSEQTYNKSLEVLNKVKGSTFVGVHTMRDKFVRPTHQINEGKYFNTSQKTPWLDPRCRCKYIFGTEPYLKSIGFTKLTES